MDNQFFITIKQHAAEQTFSAALLTSAYSYKINVELNGYIVSYEPDEERNFRAMVLPEDQLKISSKDKILIELIAAELMQLFKD